MNLIIDVLTNSPHFLDRKRIRKKNENLNFDVRGLKGCMC